MDKQASNRWRLIDRKRATFRKTFRPVMRKALDESITPFLEQIKSVSDITNVVNYVEYYIEEEKIEKAFKSMYRETMKEFAQYDNVNIQKAAGIQYQKKSIYENLIDEEIQRYIESGQIGLLISAVQGTSKKIMRRKLEQLIPDILERGLGMGEAQTLLRDSIEDEWYRANRWRTERITRTEVSAASNLGSYKGVEITGVAKTKSWVSALDERTRTDPFNHFHSQTVAFDGVFDKTGENILYPVDHTNGSAGNTINCRCTLTYSVN